MPLDGNAVRSRLLTDEELDREIMRGSPFAMPMPAAQTRRSARRSTMPLGDFIRAMAALGMVFAAVAGLGAVILG